MSAAKRRVIPTSVEQALDMPHWDLRVVADLCRLVLREVYAGKVETAKAHAITALCNTAIRALDKGDLEARLEELEGLLSQRGESDGWPRTHQAS
jgi:hypothetical protein